MAAIEYYQDGQGSIGNEARSVAVAYVSMLALFMALENVEETGGP